MDSSRSLRCNSTAGIVAGLNRQRKVGPIIPDIADHFADRPDFRCVGARLEQRHQLVLGRRSFTQPFQPIGFVQNDRHPIMHLQACCIRLHPPPKLLRVYGSLPRQSFNTREDSTGGLGLRQLCFESFLPSNGCERHALFASSGLEVAADRLGSFFWTRLRSVTFDVQYL
jgi:hypothetical protein